MSGCGFCGVQRAGAPPLCAVCDRPMQWTERHHAKTSYSPRQRGWERPSWVWLCADRAEPWHRIAAELIVWAEGCPDGPAAAFALERAKSMRPEGIE